MKKTQKVARRKKRKQFVKGGLGAQYAKYFTPSPNAVDGGRSDWLEQPSVFRNARTFVTYGVLDSANVVFGDAKLERRST